MTGCLRTMSLLLIGKCFSGLSRFEKVPDKSLNRLF